MLAFLVQDMRVECTSLSGFSWPWWIQRKRFGVFAPSLSLNCKHTLAHVGDHPQQDNKCLLGFIVSGYGIFCIFVVSFASGFITVDPKQLADIEWFQVTTNPGFVWIILQKNNFRYIYYIWWLIKRFNSTRAPKRQRLSPLQCVPLDVHDRSEMVKRFGEEFLVSCIV